VRVRSKRERLDAASTELSERGIEEDELVLLEPLRDSLRMLLVSLESPDSFRRRTLRGISKLFG
jgi:hypothetical protein